MTQPIHSRLSTLAITHLRQGNSATALELWRWALIHAQAAGNFVNECLYRNNMAVCLRNLGQYAEALSTSLAVLAIVDGFSDEAYIDIAQRARSNASDCQHSLHMLRAERMFDEGMQLYKLGDNAGALAIWKEARFMKPGNALFIANCTINIALCYYNAKRYSDAATILADFTAISESGALNAFTVSPEEEERYILNSRKITDAARALEAIQLLDECDVHLANRDYDRLLDTAESALAALDATAGRDNVIGALVLDRLAVAQYRQNIVGEAQSNWREALRLAQKWAQSAHPELVGRIQSSLDRCLDSYQD